MMLIELTPKEFLKAGKSVQVDPSCTYPAGPAPQTIARDVRIMIMKRTILISDVEYSNQANTLFGSVKMTKVQTKKIDTKFVRGFIFAANLLRGCHFAMAAP